MIGTAKATNYLCAMIADSGTLGLILLPLQLDRLTRASSMSILGSPIH